MSITSKTPFLTLLQHLRVNRENNSHALFCISGYLTEDQTTDLIHDYVPVAYKTMTAKTLQTFVKFPSISSGLAIEGFEKNLEKRAHFWLTVASGEMPEKAKSILAERNPDVLQWLVERKVAGAKVALEKEKAKKVTRDKRDERKRLEAAQATEAAKLADAVLDVPVGEVKALRLRVLVLETENEKLVKKYDALEAQADKANSLCALSEAQNVLLSAEVESLKAALTLAQAPVEGARKVASVA